MCKIWACLTATNFCRWNKCLPSFPFYERIFCLARKFGKHFPTILAHKSSSITRSHVADSGGRERHWRRGGGPARARTLLYQGWKRATDGGRSISPCRKDESSRESSRAREKERRGRHRRNRSDENQLVRVRQTKPQRPRVDGIAIVH